MGDGKVFDGREFRKAAQEVPDLLFAHLYSRFETYGKAFSHGTLVKKRLSGRPGLISHSGAAGIKGTFDSRLTGADLSTLRLIVYTTSKVAPIHEFGGTIVARVAQYLVFFYELIQQWVTKKEVKIPARLEFFKTWEDDWRIRSRLYSAAMEAALRDMGEG